MRARRLPVLDRVERDGESVVLVDERVVRLSALATTLLAECAGWAEVGDLAAGLVARFGAPDSDESLDATIAALADLRDQGLVEID